MIGDEGFGASFTEATPARQLSHSDEDGTAPREPQDANSDDKFEPTIFCAEKTFMSAKQAERKDLLPSVLRLDSTYPFPPAFVKRLNKYFSN